MYSKATWKDKILVILILAFVAFLAFKEIQKTKIQQELKKEVKKETVLISHNIHPKKRSFLKLLLPNVIKIYNELYTEFEAIKELIQSDPTNIKIEELKIKYEVITEEELLIALKPHPISITLAQAALESAWGSSRFFKEANNIFGVWSFNENEPRIAANIKRDEKTIYLKKFETLEEAIRQYYNMISSKKIYFDFKKENYYSNTPLSIVQKLTSYSEQGEEYTKKVISVIKYNKFTQYDKILK